MTVFLALRNLMLQRRRYTMIAVAIACGFALITVISGASGGAMAAIRAKAARYFAGAVSVTGYSPSGVQRISDPDPLVELLASGLDGARSVSKRTIYYRTDAEVFFGGESIRQRRLVGVDFSRETAEFSDMDFTQGGADAMAGPDGARGVLISASAAELLGARLGDRVELFLTTDKGQYNTASLVVRGVFAETSLFGYVAYVRNEDLNELLGRPVGSATDIAVYAEPGTDLASLAREAHRLASGARDTMPLAADRDERQEALRAKRSGDVLVVMSLDSQLAQIADIMDAFMAVTYFVLAVFVLIVMVGILNTYRVIVYERTKEIGTMRALGMGRGAVVRLFTFEAAALALASSVAGLAIGLALLRALGFVDLGAIPAAGMFTSRGRLVYSLGTAQTLMNLAAMVLAVSLAALGPARSAGSIRPADAMRAEG